MDWFLFHRDLRHERVNLTSEGCKAELVLQLYLELNPWLIISPFCKMIQSSYFPLNFLLQLHQWKLNWEQRVFDGEPCMRWIWSWPVTMELFFKIAVRKKEAKSLKTALSRIVNKKYNNIINITLDILIIINITHHSSCFQILGTRFF